MKTLKVLVAGTLSALLAACAVEKSETPLAPTVAGPIAGVNITAPKGLEPSAGALIPGDRQPVTLLLENPASTTGFSRRTTCRQATVAGRRSSCRRI